jgi:nitroreductase
VPAPQVPYKLPYLSPEEQVARLESFLGEMRGRRSCRFFSDRPVDRRLIEAAVAIAHTAPSGANRQPWRFVAVEDPAIKHDIRAAAEAEEKQSYERRMPREWLDALEPFGTTWQKPFLEIAPWLVVVFRVDYEISPEGQRLRTYYPAESVGIACGLFLAACRMAGLATLTHTPSPMNFLRTILHRPDTEKPFLLIPVGYPADDATVPDLPKKALTEILHWNR